MKLFRLKISGVPFDSNTGYTDAQLNGNEPYVLADTNPSAPDYDDITTVENINSIGFGLPYDYKYVRDILKDLVTTTGWVNLTANEKTIATTHKIGTHAERLAALGGNVDTLVALGVQYHSKVSEVRKIRLAYAVSCVHNHLEHIMVGPYTAPEVILSEILPHNYLYTFMDLGLGGIVDGDNSEGLFDYLNSTVGTSWENTGLRSKTWTPEGLADMDTFCNKVMDILQKGKY